MTSYTIKELEKVSGIKAHTIRIWEQRYNFIQPKRTETNIRTYSGEELKVILNVSLLNRYGFKISHINKMTSEQIEDKILSLNQIDAQKERIINDMIKEMISLNMPEFEKLIDNHTAQKGIEKTITEILFTFLERVGILWVTNYINPTQEHLVTNIIRQKIIAGIEKLPKLNGVSQRIALFMPEGEYHEMGILYVYFLMKQRGVYVDYLGSNVPIIDLKYLTEVKKVDYLYCHITSPTKQFKINKFFDQLNLINKDIPIIISGQLIQNYTGSLGSNVHLKRSLAETMDFLKTIY